MQSLLVPGSVGVLSALLGRKSFQHGYHDIGVVLFASSALVSYFCYYDYRRRSSEDYKTKLVAQRKSEYDEKNTPYVVKILSKLSGQITVEGGSPRFLMNPVIQQQLVMREVQTGEQFLGVGDSVKALERFSTAAVLSAITGGLAKGENLIATVSRMLPHLAAQLEAQFKSDYDAAKRYLTNIAKEQAPSQPALTRDEMLQSLKPAPAVIEDVLDVDSIDDSEEEQEDLEEKKEAPQEVAAPVVEVNSTQSPVVSPAPVETLAESAPVEAVAEVAPVAKVEPVVELPVSQEEEENTQLSEPLMEEVFEAEEEPTSQPEILTDSAFQEQSQEEQKEFEYAESTYLTPRGEAQMDEEDLA